MSRPVSHGEVTAVDIDGSILLHVDGIIHGSKELRMRVWVAILTSESVPLVHGEQPVSASLDSPLGVAAALVSASPGRARLIAAPQSVWSHLTAGEEAANVSR